MSPSQVTQAHPTVDDCGEFTDAVPFSALSKEIPLCTVEHCRVLINWPQTWLMCFFFMSLTYEELSTITDAL